MEVKAKAKYIKMSPRKVRLVADMIRGKKALAALETLEFSTRWAKRPLLKLLNSAIANAEHNFELKKDNLYIKTLKVDGGPFLKRYSPRAFGRAGTIRKRTSHIEIVLDELEQGGNDSAKEKLTEITSKVKTQKHALEIRRGSKVKTKVSLRDKIKK